MARISSRSIAASSLDSGDPDSAPPAGAERARSDFDFIVTLAPDPAGSISDRHFGLAEALESLLGRRVDLLTNQPIRNPFLRRAVEASRRDLHPGLLAAGGEGFAPLRDDF